MKKIFTKINLILPSIIFAADKRIEENTESKSLADFLTSIKDFLLLIAGGVAVLFIIIGGIKLITSAGNSQRVENAKKTITYSIIGLILIILSEVILGIMTGEFLSLFK